MAVRIRLRRTGAKNSASFRVVAADAHSPRDGRFLETLGWYDPTKDGANFSLKMERIDSWVSQGAQVSDTVRSLIRRVGKPVAEPKAVAAEEAEPEMEPVFEPAGAEETAAPAVEPVSGPATEEKVDEEPATTGPPTEEESGPTPEAGEEQAEPASEEAGKEKTEG